MLILALIEERSFPLQTFFSEQVSDYVSPHVTSEKNESREWLLNSNESDVIVQGGSNMTGTNCDFITHKSVPVIFWTTL